VLDGGPSSQLVSQHQECPHLRQVHGRDLDSCPDDINCCADRRRSPACPAERLIPTGARARRQRAAHCGETAARARSYADGPGRAPAGRVLADHGGECRPGTPVPGPCGRRSSAWPAALSR
jgi:hypothetical protein